MLRSSSDVVPVVQPRYRLEEDARRAAERRRQLGAKQVSATGARVERYRIVSRSDVREVLKNNNSNSNDNNNNDTKEEGGGARLFTLLPSPELGERLPQSLHVLEAPRKTWKRARRTVYMASMQTARASDDSDDDDDKAPRFSSLPLPEYENMACVLLSLSPAGEAETGTDTESLARAMLLDAPLHALHYERTENGKAGQGISTSWYSGVDVRSVGFKRSYIDDDGGEEAWDAESSFSDDAETNARQGGQKRREEKANGQSASKKNKADTATGSPGALDGSLHPDEPQQMTEATRDEAPASVLPASSLRPAAETPRPVDRVDFAGINPEDLNGLTAVLLQQWASMGKTVVPFNEVAKVVLKVHPKYTQMKAKHQSAQSRPEAVEWFRVSQSGLRAHVLQLGYTIDSTNNVYLSQSSTG